MAENHKFIDIVHKLGRKNYNLEGVYRRIQDESLFLAPYGKLYANTGAMTPGTDQEDIVDGMSVKRINTIIEKLQKGIYEWKPVRRIYIPKRKGSQRPLGIPTWNDKLLQGVMQMVLEAYYEPRFSDYSHGFRPNRGCHTALNDIHRTWKGVKWFIEGDIKGCFDNIDWYVLLEILGRDIKDDRFLKLIRRMLEAGYMDGWLYHKTYAGTPQGGVISPLLANIYLNELDKFVETELLPKFNQGKRKEDNPDYIKLKSRLAWAKKEGNREKVKELKRQRRKLPSKNPQDPNYCRLRYNRYADDFVLGFDGPYQTAMEIRDKIHDFLKTIKLELSKEKTLITAAATKPARYLGYNVQIAKDDNRLTNGQRRLNMQPLLTVPDDIISQWRKKYTKAGKVTHRSELIQCSDYEIVKTYDTELRGIVNYLNFVPIKAQTIKR